jgi:hypothetical protein
VGLQDDRQLALRVREPARVITVFMLEAMFKLIKTIQEGGHETVIIISRW